MLRRLLILLRRLFILLRRLFSVKFSREFRVKSTPHDCQEPLPSIIIALVGTHFNFKKQKMSEITPSRQKRNEFLCFALVFS